MKSPDNLGISSALKKAFRSFTKCTADAKDFPSVINCIDKEAGNIAISAGTAMYKAGLTQLRWFVSQYRGTALSGERPFSKIYTSPKLINPHSNMLLLGIYWKVYGLGATIAELFEQRVLPTSSRSSSENAQPESVNWDTLYVTPVNEINELSLIKKDRSHLELKVPSAWLDFLVPNDGLNLWSDTRAFLTEPNNNALKKAANTLGLNKPGKENDKTIFFEKLERDKTFQKITRGLKLRVQMLLARLLWEQENQTDTTKSVKSTLDFFQIEKPVEDKLLEQKLQQILQAIQILSIYWKWMDLKSDRRGPLVVCIPTPADLQPRMGFSMLLTDKSITVADLDSILKIWGSELDSLGDAIRGKVTSSNGGIKHDLVHQANDIGLKLKADELLKFLPSGDTATNQLLLQRLIPILGEISTITPKFVHEGKRYMVTVFIGLPYHEQILGECLGKVSDFITDLCGKIPKGCGLGESRQQFKYLELLIKSSFSLFDWNGVGLFCCFDPDEKKAVRITSMIRLPERVRDYSTTEMLKSVTRTNSELFAINVDKGANIRVFCGGKLILFKDKRGWHIGSADDEISELLFKQLIKIGVIKIGIAPQAKAKAKAASEAFVKSLLRISDEPHSGALFVITNRLTPLKGQLSVISEPPHEIWKDVQFFNTVDRHVDIEKKSEIFHRLSIMDGATVIRLGSGTAQKCWNDAIVEPRKLVNQGFDLDELYSDIISKGTWQDWAECKSYGSRRASAFALAMNDYLENKKIGATPSLVVIAVSADGPIYFMVGGETPVTVWPDSCL